MPIQKINGEIIYTPMFHGDVFVQTGVTHGSQFAIMGEKDFVKQLKFNVDNLQSNTTTTISGGATAGDITLTLPATTGTLATTADTGINQLTGDVTAGPGTGSQAATIAANAVTNAKMATMAANTVKANVTGSTTTPTDVTAIASPATASSFVLRDSAGVVRDYDPAYVATTSDHFMLGSIPGGLITKTSSGVSNISALNSTSTHPGVWVLKTGTGTSSWGALIGSDVDQVLVPVGGGSFLFEFLTKVSALSDGTDTYTLQVGLTDDPYNGSIPPTTNGIYFTYSHGSNSGKWSLNTMASTVVTSSDTGSAVVADTWVKLSFVINTAGTSIQAFVNGVSAGSPITTNIPTGSTMFSWVIRKSAGTTSRSAFFDYYKMTKILTTPL